MLQKNLSRLLVSAAPVLILATSACGGEVSRTVEGQATTEPSLVPRPTATAEPPVEEPTQAPSEAGNVLVQVEFDHDHTASGLLLDTGGDVDTEVVSVGSPPEQAFRTANGRVLPSPDGNTEQDWYMQFRVDDGFIYAGSPTSHVRIEIEYLDEGTDKFSIQYDAVSGGPSGDGRFKESNAVTKTDTREFRTAVFTLSDAYFANRDNGADFRISDYSDGAETIRRVTVTLLSPPELLADEQATIVFHNGVILTMEAGSVASAIAVKDERVLDVGNDGDMLAYAGPGTALIDLQGRTLMPGFVDSHSHVFLNWADDLEGAQAFILANGITTYAEMAPPETVLQDLLALDRQGRLRLRVSLYPAHVDSCGNLLGAWYLEDYAVSREPGAMLQIPGVKIFNDGGSCNLPAVSFENRDGSGHGDLYLTVEELTEVIVQVQGYGYQVAIHGCGDRAIEVNQDAIEAALAGGPNTYRHRIEHNTLLRDEMLSRYSEIGIVAVILGAFPTCFFSDETGQYRGLTPDEFLYWEWRWRDLIDANPDAHIAWQADYPAMGFPLDPIKQLYGFITRRHVRDDGTIGECELPEWAADDLLTAEEALPMMTIEAAYALLRDDEIGSLRAGKLADLIILSDNPLEVDHDAILDIQVLMTMVGGSVEHCAQGHEALCP